MFVLDEPLLAALQLSGKRIVFLTETLAEIGTTRELEIVLGRPEAALNGIDVAVTHAPEPGFASKVRAVEPAELHPWPWLTVPTGGSIASFSAWRRTINLSHLRQAST